MSSNFFIENFRKYILFSVNASYPLYAVVSIVVLLKKAHLNKVRLKKSLQNHVNADQNEYFENFNRFLN